jgi:hypothetical protein
MLFIYAAIVLMDRAYTSIKTHRQRYLLAILTGIVIYLAYGTRSLGLALIPAVVLTDIVRLKRISRFTLIIIAVFAALYLTQNAALQTDRSYLNIFESSVKSFETSDAKTDRKSLTTIDKPPASTSFGITPLLRSFAYTLKRNAERYHQAMSSYWTTNVSVLLDNILYAVMGLFAIAGFIALLLKNPSSGDCLVIVYVSVLLLVPFVQVRYLLPLIPLYLIYIFRGMEVLIHSSASFEKRFSYGGGVLAMLLVIALSNIGTYSSMSFADISNGIDKKESLDLFEYIKNETPADSILISRKPRLLALFTERKSSVYAWPQSPQNLLRYFEKINATHVITAKKTSGINEKRKFAAWVRSSPENFELIYENPDFRVYRIL